MFKVALICGGPSQERGISLNSARSLMDHLLSDDLEIYPIYVDTEMRFYAISQGQLYSNTPADFDFKLKETAQHLNESELLQRLKRMDLIFPCIHGYFGEDGQLQSFLEQHQVPFVGLSSQACQKAFFKDQARAILKENGFKTIPYQKLANDSHLLENIKKFYSSTLASKAVLKPICGGSSLGVHVVEGVDQTFKICHKLYQEFSINDVLIEDFCQGREFTVVVLENSHHLPVALIPTEIEMKGSSNPIFDYRRKYLPTNDTLYHTPPTFELRAIQEIRNQAEKLFMLFGMQDFVRMDGWLSPSGEVYFTDLNPISGLEQNSFLFRQSSLIGLDHRNTLLYIIESAIRRHQIANKINFLPDAAQNFKKPVFILAGGMTAERQVSLMSGTNVWLKLLQSKDYIPSLFLMTADCFWQIPYSYALSHTVEEILENCLNPHAPLFKDLIEQIQLKLAAPNFFTLSPPIAWKWVEFLEMAKREKAFIFLGLHGGIGEDGTLQQKLDEYSLIYNGSGAESSRLCIDKALTGKVIQNLQHEKITSLRKEEILFSQNPDLSLFWKELCRKNQTTQFIIKPKKDGCSAGIVMIQSLADLSNYKDFLLKGAKSIPANTFARQPELIEMPALLETEFILEPYIETDLLAIKNHQLHHTVKKGWLELTIGVIENQGALHALNPSITVAEGAVLSLEEKFQGGTGVNITPPPLSLINQEVLNQLKSHIEKTAECLGIQNYARLDLFFNIFSHEIVIIEANTLPALTPSTVLFHQALAEQPPLVPLKLLEHFILTKSPHLAPMDVHYV